MTIPELYQVFNAQYTDLVNGLIGVVRNGKNTRSTGIRQELTRISKEAHPLTHVHALFLRAVENEHQYLIQRDAKLFHVSNFLGTLLNSKTMSESSGHVYDLLHDEGRSKLWGLVSQLYQVSTVIDLRVNKQDVYDILDVMIGSVGVRGNPADLFAGGQPDMLKNLTPGVLTVLRMLSTKSIQNIKSTVSTLQTVVEVFIAASEDTNGDASNMSNMLSIITSLRHINFDDEESVIQTIRKSGLVSEEHLQDLLTAIEVMTPGEDCASDTLVKTAWTPMG
jgi:hypothetical protein